MNKFERNKIMGAVFGALLALMTVKVSSRIIFEVHPADPKSFPVDDMDTPGTTGPGEPGPAVPQEPLSVLLAKANITSGEKVARICQACHNLQEGAGAKVGPDLYKIVGRAVASVSGFNYSKAMRQHGQNPQTAVWTFENIFHFIKNPRGEVPGTAMTFAGIEDAQKRADLIVYLNSLGSNLPLPKVEQTQKTSAPSADKSSGKQETGKT